VFDLSLRSSDSDSSTIGVVEAVLLSLPTYIKHEFTKNCRFMLHILPMSMSEKWPDKTNLTNFRLKIPMVDIVTRHIAFEGVFAYFKAILLGNIDPPEYEHFSLKGSAPAKKKTTKVVKRKIVDLETNETEDADEQRSNTSKKTSAVSTTGEVIIEQPREEGTVSEKRPAALIIEASSDEVTSPIIEIFSDSAKEKSVQQEKHVADENNGTKQEERLHKKIIERVKIQHARLLMKIKKQDIPADILDDMENMGRTLSWTK